MKIEISTVRDIEDEDYWDWARATFEAFNSDPIRKENVKKGLASPVTMETFKELFEKKEIIIWDKLPHTNAMTIYRIVEEKGEKI